MLPYDGSLRAICKYFHSTHTKKVISINKAKYGYQKKVKIALLSCFLPFEASTIDLDHSNDRKSIHVPHHLMSKYTVN